MDLAYSLSLSSDNMSCHSGIEHLIDQLLHYRICYHEYQPLPAHFLLNLKGCQHTTTQLVVAFNNVAHTEQCSPAPHHHQLDFAHNITLIIAAPLRHCLVNHLAASLTTVRLRFPLNGNTTLLYNAESCAPRTQLGCQSILANHLPFPQVARLLVATRHKSAGFDLTTAGVETQVLSRARSFTTGRASAKCNLGNIGQLSPLAQYLNPPCLSRINRIFLFSLLRGRVRNGGTSTNTRTSSINQSAHQNPLYLHREPSVNLDEQLHNYLLPCLADSSSQRSFQSFLANTSNLIRYTVLPSTTVVQLGIA